MFAKNIVLAAVVLFISTPLVLAASIEGVVVFEGQPPKPKMIRMDSDPVCLTQQKDKSYSQSLVLGKDQGLANVIVRVINPPVSVITKPTTPIVITQEGCNYAPHVNVVWVGQIVKILNPDGTLHNVHSLSKVNAPFNSSMPKFRKELEQVFNKVESPFALKCDVHPWMLAWLTVVDNPYTVVTNADGQYALPNLPDGQYDIEFWHERLGIKKAQANVVQGKATVNQLFSVSDIQ